MHTLSYSLRTLIIASLSLLLSLPSFAAERYIHVSGEGQLELLPDYLDFSLLLQAEAATSGEAKALVDQAMHQLLETTAALGIETEHIDAANISSQPVYEWHNNQRTLRAQRVQRSVNLKLYQLSQHTELVHQLLQQEHLHIQQSQGHFNDPFALSLQATELALQQAQDKATAMAATLGVRLGKVLTIEEQGVPLRPVYAVRMNAAMADSSSSAPAPMLLQKHSITSTVQVRFELK